MSKELSFSKESEVKGWYDMTKLVEDSNKKKNERKEYQAPMQPETVGKKDGVNKDKLLMVVDHGA